MGPSSLPSDVYLDTSIVVAATIAGISHSSPSQAFCEALGVFGTRLYVSELLYVEFANALRSLASPRNHRRPRLSEQCRQQFGLDNWLTAEAVRHGWVQFGQQQLDGFLQQFTEVVILPLSSSSRN